MILLRTALLNMFTNKFPQREPQNSIMLIILGTQIHFLLCFAWYQGVGGWGLGEGPLLGPASLRLLDPLLGLALTLGGWKMVSGLKQRRARLGYLTPASSLLWCRVPPRGSIRLHGPFLLDGFSPTLQLMEGSVNSFLPSPFQPGVVTTGYSSGPGASTPLAGFCKIPCVTFSKIHS